MERIVIIMRCFYFFNRGSSKPARGNRKKKLMKIWICDGEKSDIDELKSLIDCYKKKKDIGNVEVRVFGDAAELIQEMIDGDAADIIILDAMIAENGTEDLLKKIRTRNSDSKVILLISEMRHVLDGYQMKTDWILLKENPSDRFFECMDRLCSDIREKRKILSLSCVEGDFVFSRSKILFIESEGHRCTIHELNGDYHIYRRLDELEERIDSPYFIRIHQSYLVNVKYIQRISNYELTMADGCILPVSKARYKQVQREYAENKMN